MQKFKTIIPYGYNISNIGGSGIYGKSWGKHNEETKLKINESVIKTLSKPEIRRKISESVSGEKNGFYGKKHTEETKRKIGDKNKGKKRTEEHKQKIREANKKPKTEQKSLLRMGLKE